MYVLQIQPVRLIDDSCTHIIVFKCFTVIILQVSQERAEVNSENIYYYT